jgi:hypothetical protein
MEQYHSPVGDAKQYSCNAAAGKAAPNFPKAVSHRADQRHTDWLGELNVLDVFAEDLLVDWIKTPQPFPDRFTSAFRTVEEGRQTL